MKVEKCNLPPNSLLNGYLPADHSDAVVCTCHTAVDFTPDDIQVAFWTAMPGWVDSLMKLRNVLVRPFGLVSDNGPGREAVERCLREGGECGFLKVLAKSAEETVILLADKHLDAYVSVLMGHSGDMTTVTVITLVKYNNALGRVYFFVIRPFHNVIVRTMLRHILRGKCL